MKKNNLKIAFTALFLSSISFNALRAAEDSFDSYGDLYLNASRVTSAAIGYDAGSTISNLFHEQGKIAYSHIKHHFSPNERVENATFKTVPTSFLNIFKTVGLLTLSRTLVGPNQIYYFAYGFLAGAGKTTASLISSYVNQEEANVCSICIDQERPTNPNPHDLINPSHEIRTLNCGHKYHVDCIDEWLATQHTCPTCRTATQ